MWTQIGAGDLQGLNRQVAIMRQMDHSYASLQAQDLVAAITQRQGEVWYYEDTGFEIGLLFQYSQERGHWQLAQLGFVGTVQPSQVLDIVVMRGRDFLNSHGVPSLFAVRPATMDYQPLLTLYDLCLTHPSLSIRVVLKTDTKTIWEITYVGPPPLGQPFGALAQRPRPQPASAPAAEAPLPPLPADTAGRWLDVIREDEAMVRRWLNVTHQMDASYRREGVREFGDTMAHRPWARGGSYYYWTQGSEVVVRLQYYPRREQHQVLSVGFVGNISPQAALDLVIDKSVQYLRERQLRSAFAVVPRQTENPNIMRLYDLVPLHPRLQVTIEAESPNAKRLNILVPEILPP